VPTAFILDDATPATASDLLVLLEAGALVLLPSARAARDLRAAYDAHQQAQGTPAWPAPRALAWQQWTTSLWSELVLTGRETRLLLNAAQEQAVWREIVTPTGDLGRLPALRDSLAPLEARAALARSAWQRAAAWNALPALRSAAAHATASVDAKTFAQWAAAFTQLCAQRGLLSVAQLEAELAIHARAGALPAVPTLYLAGFLTLDPAQQSLLEALSAQGVAVHAHRLVALPDSATEASSLCAAGPRDELLHAAHWLHEIFEAAEAPARTPRVAVLLPDLTADRAELDSVLRDVLAPELQAIDADLSSTPWEFAAGLPLTQHPLIAAALELARWTLQPLPLDRITALLLAPCVGREGDRDLAARFDARLRRKEHLLRPELSLNALVQLLSKHSSPLAWPIELARARPADLNRPRTFADWTEALRQMLTAAHWPGPRPLTASDFAATRAWDGLLDLIATLDFAGRRVPFAAALDALERHAAETPLLPPSTHAPIQIMTPPDALGASFDAVLWLRCTAESWPAPEHPHPLLPFALQRSLHMPGADPAAAVQHARQLTAELLARTPRVLFTWATRNDDGEFEPSPLLAALAVPALPSSPTPDEPPPLTLDDVPDAAPLPPLPSLHVPGGATVLKEQAACGFRAFAGLRLHAHAPDALELGYDPRESGTHLHRALQEFWRQVRSQQALRALPTEERQRILHAAIATALADIPHGDWDQAYLDLQRRRLFNLLEEWLALEVEQRGPFVVIESERPEPVQVGPLTVDVRFDRIDRIDVSAADAEGSSGFVLVDYKTGRAGEPKQWEGLRPEEPQLPLYALHFAPEEIHALTFARIRAGEMRWRGLQATAGILPRPHSNRIVELPAYIANWRAVLDRLAEDFAAGRAAVDPARGLATCEHCPQRILCRLDPLTLATNLESDDADDEEAPDV